MYSCIAHATRSIHIAERSYTTSCEVKRAFLNYLNISRQKFGSRWSKITVLWSLLLKFRVDFFVYDSATGQVMWVCVAVGFISAFLNSVTSFVFPSGFHIGMWPNGIKTLSPNPSTRLHTRTLITNIIPRYMTFSTRCVCTSWSHVDTHSVTGWCSIIDIVAKIRDVQDLVFAFTLTISDIRLTGFG